MARQLPISKFSGCFRVGITQQLTIGRLIQRDSQSVVDKLNDLCQFGDRAATSHNTDWPAAGVLEMGVE